MKAKHIEKTEHPCQFPVAIPQRLIRALVPTDGLVLDPFMGSGTTGVSIKKNLVLYWNDDTSKLLSVITINGFIIALTRQLSINGVQDFDFYDQKFRNWHFDFSKEGFPYTSSQYRKFSSRILEETFGLSPDIIGTL